MKDRFLQDQIDNSSSLNYIYLLFNLIKSFIQSNLSNISENTINTQFTIQRMIQQQQHLQPEHPSFSYYYPTLNHSQQPSQAQPHPQSQSHPQYACYDSNYQYNFNNALLSPNTNINSNNSNNNYDNHQQFMPLAPTLNKITTDSITKSLYCAYSDGKVLRYDTKTNTLTNIFSVYDKVDVIDVQSMGNMLLTTSHNQVTIFDMVKHKSMALKGHEQTPISASAHPISPLVVSVSNLVILHDLRIRKPINVNFITPPVYQIKYFPDGSHYFLSGEPCRIGRNNWQRTLLNGIGSVSDNCKYVATNQMNGNLVLWNWRKSTRQVVISDVKNQQIYQNIYFRREHGQIRGLIFLQDDGMLLEYDLLSGRSHRRLIIPNAQDENWKIHVDSEENTQLIYAYQHEKSVVKCYMASKFMHQI